MATMTDFLAALTDLSEWAFTQLGQVWTFISGNPALIAVLGLSFVGFIVGLWNRFVR